MTRFRLSDECATKRERDRIPTDSMNDAFRASAHGEAVHGKIPHDGAVEKLRDLLSYVEQVVKLDERCAFRLSEHRLATGQALVLHQHELSHLPGAQLDILDEDGPIWLSVERLKRSEAPVPSETIAPWIELSPDPEREPIIRAHLLRTVPPIEKDAMVAANEARAEDCAEALKAKEGEPSAWDIRLRLEDRPETRCGIDCFLKNGWKPWADAERPVRRSIALYQGLFEIVQLGEMGGGDQPFELVWGMGLTRWLVDGREVDLPLIERLVEVEIATEASATIRVRPRATPAIVNLRAFEELRVEGATLALDAARRTLAAIDPDEGASPFARDDFEPTLRACQARLAADGRYLPDHAALAPTEPPPAATSQLTVSDRWVLFARRRSDNFLLTDLENLKGALEAVAAGADLPGPARTLVMGPADEPEDSVWTPLGAGIGESEPLGGAGAGVTPDEDLFFPKPFNDDQIAIVRRLEQADGVVVQGPPGTGKTHTISNIICHFLATGRRVLVVSHGEPALAVLRDHLPEGVRDLAISITATEREGFRQLETAVRVLQSIVGELSPHEQLRSVRDSEAAILAMRRRLAEIDAEIEDLARAQLEPVGAMAQRPAELAQAVAASREQLAWFTDRPDRFAADADLADADIDALRAARAALGSRIEHLEAVLPAAEALPAGETLARLHQDLVEATELAAEAGEDAADAVRITDAASLAQAERAIQALDVFRRAHAVAAERPWLADMAVAAVEGEGGLLVEASREFAAAAGPVLSRRPQFLSAPVDTPQELGDSAEAASIVARLADGEAVFGFFAFRERSLRPLIEAVRVSGRVPADASDWAHVRDHLAWRDDLRVLDLRWRALAQEVGAPSEAAASTRGLEELTAELETILNEAPRAARALDEALRLAMTPPPAAAMLWPDAERRDRLDAALRKAAEAARLSTARGEVQRLATLFSGRGGALAELARELLLRGIGRSDLMPDAVARAWDGLRLRIQDLAGHGAQFEAVRSLTERVAQAGAPRWAGRLRSEAGEGVIPADWRGAWDWGAASAFLARIDERQRLGVLSDERVKRDADLRRTFERLVRERTFYSLGQRMKGPVRSALMMLATALRRTGKGTGRGAARHRREARSAMALCYDAIPCWIMPSWRVAEQLPGQLGSFDLVIMDEASQSDIREVSALLRGRKILVVGDDKQVSPTAAFIENAKIDRLEHNFLKGMPFKTLLLPGSSLYDLAKVMFPDKLVMLREHFRCVEPIIRFSMQFYPEPLVPLRVPIASERLDPPLIDIYVPDGRREGDKINPREAEVIVEEIKRIVDDPALGRIAAADRWRSIGVISLIGSKQAALINKRLLDAVGEEMMLRHRIACGDSATFQGNERDIVFLSMVADRRVKQTQTAAHFEQRFNVALSRARDRLVLVRSVREEDLNPSDLKARIIRHFRDPMAGAGAGSGDPAERCESDFEREVMRRLVELGYRVRPQVGALGYRIDLVVEGLDDRRLAIECDGDQYHGPERWADDMRRQRILERVGWRFWRCWASSFALDPDACMADLIATLARMEIEPAGADNGASVYTLHRTAEPARSAPDVGLAAAGADVEEPVRAPRPEKPSAEGIRIGDRVVLRDLDDNRSTTFTLSEDRDDRPNGLLAASSPLGRAVLGLIEEDEAAFQENGRQRRVVVLRTERVRLEEAV